MDPFTIAAIIAGVVGLGSAVAGYISNSETNASNQRSVDSTNEINAQLQRETNRLSVQEANKNRSYYSPQNLMQMYKSAGLNSNLMASSGFSSVGAGSSTPSLGTASMASSINQAFDPSRYGNTASSAVDAALKVAQINKTNEESKNTSADTKLKGSQIQLNETTRLNVASDTHLKGFQIQQIKATCDLFSTQQRQIMKDIELKMAQIEKTYNESSLTREQMMGQVIENTFQMRSSDARMKQLYAAIDDLVSHAGLSRAQAAVAKEERFYLAQTMASRITGASLSNMKLDAERLNILEDTTNKVLQGVGFSYDNQSKQLEFQINDANWRNFCEEYSSNTVGGAFMRMLHYSRVLFGSGEVYGGSGHGFSLSFGFGKK